MKHAQTIYDDLWDQTLPLFQQGQYEVDPQITDRNDRRRGLTLRAKLNADISLKVEEFTQRMRNLAPEQYFTPSSDLHLTILSIINCSAGFQHDSSLDKAYIEAISECIRGIPPLRIKFSGITASSSCLLLQGYPENSSLTEFRNHLREKFKRSTLPNSIDSRYPIKAAHVTIMRFQKAQSSICDFTQFITKNKNHDFGQQIIDEVELVSNDWYHKRTRTKLINTFVFNDGA